MKRSLLAVVALAAVLACSIPAKADDAVSSATIDPIGINLSDIVKSARVGAFYSLYPVGKTLALAYTPLISYHTTDGTEIANLDLGGVLGSEDDTTKGSIYFGIGVRADGVLSKAFKSTWSSAHISTASLPTIEFMFGTSWYSPTHQWIVGPSLAVKF